jgi:aspartate/tyrosine/aromatic aminotransferase
MSKSYSIAVPRYQIRGIKGDVFDVFNKRTNAIRAAISMATEYPGATFQVIKQVLHKEKLIFQFKIETQVEFDDIQDMYRGLIEIYQKKLNKTRFWRKPDGA